MMGYGHNAIRVFGLDEQYLQEVATRIGASTPTELLVAPDPDTLPPNDGNGFIGQSGPRPVEQARVERAERRRAQMAAAVGGSE